jgi:hypothetical protein
VLPVALVVPVPVVPLPAEPVAVTTGTLASGATPFAQPRMPATLATIKAVRMIVRNDIENLA